MTPGLHFWPTPLQFFALVVSPKLGLQQYRIQYYLPNNIILSLIIDKFDPNSVLFNIDKLKPFNLFWLNPMIFY